MSEPNHSDRETLVVSRRPLVPGGMGEVLHLALPSMAAFATNVVMSFVDTVMVAGVSAGAVGAVVTGGMLFQTAAVFFGGLVSAVVTFTSQSASRGRHGEGARYAWQGIHIAVAVGLAFCLTLPALPAFFALLGHEPAVQEMEVAYLSCRVPSLVFLIGAWSMQNFFQGLGRTRLILAVTVMANSMNVLLNWLLIYGVGPLPAMGVAGAGLATLLANVVSATLFLGPFLLGRAARENGTRQGVAPSWSRMKGLLRIGLPTSLQFSLDLLAWTVWSAVLVGRLLGREALDANAVVMQIIQMAWFPVIGLGHAACSLVGWYIARGQVDRVRKSVRSTLALATAYMVAVSVLMLAASRPLVEFFFVFREAKGAEAAQLAEVIALGIVATRIAALWQIFDGLGIVLMGALRGAGDTLWPAVLMQIMAWGVFLPLAWVLCIPAGLGMAGAWWAGVVHLGLLAAILSLRYRGTAWMKKNIFRDSPDSPSAAG